MAASEIVQGESDGKLSEQQHWAWKESRRFLRFVSVEESADGGSQWAGRTQVEGGGRRVG